MAAGRAIDSATVNLIPEKDYPKIGYLNSHLRRSAAIRVPAWTSSTGRAHVPGMSEPANPDLGSDRSDALLTHSSASSLREQALSHLLLWQLAATRWRTGRHDLEVLKSEVDRGGYDIVLEAAGIIRHVQLKSSITGSKVSEISISTRLSDKPSGCVIWLDVNPATLEIERYFWFGGPPGSKLPALGSRISKHSRGDSTGMKAERPMHRQIKKSCFEPLSSAADLMVRLFGHPI